MDSKMRDLISFTFKYNGNANPTDAEVTEKWEHLKKRLLDEMKSAHGKGFQMPLEEELVHTIRHVFTTGHGMQLWR